MPLALPSAQLCAAGTKTRNRPSLWNLSVRSPGRPGRWRRIHRTRKLFEVGCLVCPPATGSPAEATLRSRAQRQMRQNTKARLCALGLCVKAHTRDSRCIWDSVHQVVRP